MERRITIEVSYRGTLPETVLEYLRARPDVLVLTRSPLTIKTADPDVLNAILGVARADKALQITSIQYRRAPAPALALSIAAI